MSASSGIALFAAAALGAATPALAVGTPAGNIISNTAKATYTSPTGESSTLDSNTVEIKVDELIDVSVASTNGGSVGVSPGSTKQILTFTVTNNGNGSEAFRLTARNSTTADDFDPTAIAVYLDSNSNGTYDPGTDVAYVPGSNDPLLAADGQITVFVLSSIGPQTDGQIARVDLIAEAVTGTGAPGTIFTSAGTNGGNAVVGTSGGDDLDTGAYQVSNAAVSLVKTAVVLDPFGGTSAVPGSIITYTLKASVSGSGTVNNVAITDAIPTGTAYKLNSITLQNTAQTDGADSDAASYANKSISVNLGNLAAGQTRTATFQVTVTK